jgi:hypothetical protein
MKYYRTTSDRIGIEQTLSKDECNALAERIFNRLYERMEEGGGTTFGIDMPTLKATFPRQFRVINRLHKAWNSAPC